jgi:uncharacterized protein YjbI with pentapeptide repeats
MTSRHIDLPRISTEPPSSALRTLADVDRVEDVAIRDADLSSDDAVAGLVLERVHLDGSTLISTQFEDLDAIDVVFEGCELSAITLNKAVLTRVAFVGCRMSGFTAPQLRAEHVLFEACKLDQALFRMAVLERCIFEDCNMRDSDFYEAELRDCVFERCELDESQFSSVRLDRVALHRSSLVDIKGAGSLSGAVIGSDQVAMLAPHVFHSVGIVVDDDYLGEVAEDSRK